MAKSRGKTVSYRRAVWLLDEGKELDFEQLIKDAHAKLPTVSARKFKRGDGQFVKSIWHAAEKAGGYYMHLVAETPGDHASTLSQAGELKDEHDVDTAPPPRGAEYMDGDVIVFVKGNDLCLCSTVLREGAIMTFCDELFRKAKLGTDATQFDLQKVASIDKLKMIKAQGVKEVSLGATLDEASTKYLNRKTAVGQAIGVVGKHFAAVLREDKPAAKDNIKVGIVLRTDARNKKGGALGSVRLQAAARELIGGDDDYVIVTNTGQRISPNEVFVRRRVEIQGHGKSVHRGKACAALKDFYGQLVKAGVTVQ